MDNTTAIATPILHSTGTTTSVTHIPPVTTLPSTCTNTPVFRTPTNQATVQISTTDASINTETQDLPVAKAILEISKSLVEALERQTFQTEITKNTLSAFLMRLDDRDRERKSPANPQIDIHICPVNWSSLNAVAVKLQFHLQQERRKRSRDTQLCLTIKGNRYFKLYKLIMKFQ